MKKGIIISVQLISLAVILAVSSFAWFQISIQNNLSPVDVPTKDGGEFVFSKNQYVEEALAPAKLKKGVLSGQTDSKWKIDGIEVPTGEALLPRTKIDDETGYTIYDVSSEGKMQFKADGYQDYFEYPATIIYSQYRFIASGSNMKFSFDVYYPKLNAVIKENEVIDEEKLATDFNKLTQVDALSFNFFVTPYDSLYTLTEEELQSASTSIGTSNSGKKTIENVLSNKVTESGKYMDLYGKEPLITVNGANPEAKETQVKSARISSTKQNSDPTKQFYSFSLKELDTLKYSGYNLIVEAYYSLPDMLIEGNVPLNGEFLLYFNVSKV